MELLGERHCKFQEATSQGHHKQFITAFSFKQYLFPMSLLPVLSAAKVNGDERAHQRLDVVAAEHHRKATVKCSASGAFGIRQSQAPITAVSLVTSAAVTSALASHHKVHALPRGGFSKAKHVKSTDMKGPCSHTYPQGENLLLSVTGVEGIQRRQLSERGLAGPGFNAVCVEREEQNCKSDPPSHGGEGRRKTGKGGGTDGRTGRQLPLRPSCIMEGLYVQPLEEDGVMTMEEEGEHIEEQEASYPLGSTTDEETDEDSEPEPPTVIRRKVSFADAFGLNLVSVKEFDNAEVTESEVSQPPEMEATRALEEFYMSCLFTVPSTPEELDQRLQAQMVELESIELLPGTTTLRGIIRVVNLCYSKSVYARITLDRWASFFDLLAEYVPGSSDRKTDRFAFKYTLVPPFEREGTRVEICLRYETSVDTFWANNKEMNYVLFCHQKAQVKEPGPQVQEEGAGYKSKRSCLKANRQENLMLRLFLNMSLPHVSLVDSIKSRHRATRLAHAQDFLSQRRQQISKAYSHDSSGQKVSQPAPWCDSANFLHKCQMRQSDERPQVLTYHQIPLLTLDWNSDKAHQWGTSHMDDIWIGRAKVTESKASVQNIADTSSVNDMWETFLNGTDDTSDKETSVCDVWQAFLNGPSCMDHSGVPESEWLQTAASVSPSNDKEPKTQYAVSSQERAFQVGADTPTTLQARTSAACQLLSDTRETAMVNVTLNAEDHQPVEACVSGLRDDNTATQRASQRSQTNSVTDTPQEFSLEGATPVSEGSVDSSAECHKHAIGEREKGGIIGGAGGIGGDEPFTLCTADFVTSSGESETTDMTAMPESQNASAVDRISQRARLDEGLSSSREGDVTADKYNPNPVEVVEMRWTHSQGDMKGPKENASRGISPGEVRVKEDVIKEDTSIELQRQPETLERIEEDMSQRDKDERVSIGKLKIEGLGELMGNVENPWGERKNAPAELKEQELSAESESSPRVEYKKLSEGTKDPITAENTGALEVIESGLEERFIERFGEDLVRGIWEEVFGEKVQASSRDTNIVGGWGSKLAEIPDLTPDCHPLFEKDFDDTFDSGVFSLSELPTDPNSSPCQGQEQTLEPRSNERYPKEISLSLTTAEQTHSLSESQTDSNLSAHLSRDLGIAQSKQSLTEPIQSPPKDRENCGLIKERSVTHQETEAYDAGDALALLLCSVLTGVGFCAFLGWCDETKEQRMP
ncbi:hypothetical protein L3Q82_000572 [Scortum barcoo]|uniref:Uncharacterized protein n=1 Tax=Scortum barcoo TaxID=214431 RepID=A0ACB8WFG8_9TELE|nr:hypothetical protein L3Q82_000572 [Scortum barcoo]